MLSRMHDPCAPPFACHTAHAIPHAGRQVRGTRKVGHQDRACETHAGLCSHALQKGCLLPFSAPWFACGSARPHCTRTGAFPCGPRSTPAREWREGACRAGWVSTPSLRPLVLARMRAAFCAPRSLGQGGSTRGEVPSQVAAHPPVGCFARLGERDARGGGCATCLRPCPVGTRTMPPLMHRRGRDQGG